MDSKTLKNNEPKLVRLKPYHSRAGLVIRDYMFQGVKFVAARGWYRVDADMARHLAEVRSIHGDENSPLAFEVATLEEARAIDRERAEAERRKYAPATADEPNPTDVTTSDAPSGDASRARRRRRRANA